MTRTAKPGPCPRTTCTRPGAGAGLLFLLLVLTAWPAAAQVSDDFRGPALDTGLWQIIDPRGQATVALDNGGLVIDLPAGTTHHSGPIADSTVRLLQDLPDADLGLEVRFESPVNRTGQRQGLVLVERDGTAVRLFQAHDGLRSVVSWERSRNHLVLGHGSVAAAGNDTLGLKLERTGDTWTAFQRLGDAGWQEVITFDHDLALTSGGVFAANFVPDTIDPEDDPESQPVDKATAGPGPPAFAVRVDYVFDPDAPIVPEDPAIRTFAGLQAFYTFGGGADPVIFDYAGTATPYHLTTLDTTATAFLPGHGLRLVSPTLVTAPRPATELNTALMASGELTLEAWLTPLSTTQDGPARILTLSDTPSLRNATLSAGQWADLPSDVVDVRLRTTTQSLNGQPDLVTAAGSLHGGLQHVAYTRDVDGNARIYLDGTEAAAGTAAGDLSNWDPATPLGLGGEMDGTRNWLGDLHLAAVYDRALDAGEIAVNHAAGPDGGQLPPLAPAIILHGVTAGGIYAFADTIALRATAGDADGTVVAVEFRAGDQLLFRDETPPYAFAWTDPGVGGHQLRAVAIDDDGLQTASATYPIVVTTPAEFDEALALSDAFFDADLGAPWTLIDGAGGAGVNQSGGSVEIALPGTGSLSPWAADPGAFRAHQDEIDTAVALDLMLDGDRWVGSATAGLALGDSLGGELRFLATRASGQWTLAWGVGAPAGSLDLGAVTGPIHLQVRRSGDAVTLLHGFDGTTWTRTAALDLPGLVVNRTGWLAGTAGGPATVALDHAFNLARPIVPEDGADGDFTGPVVSGLVAMTGFDIITLSWTTDEPAYHRVHYGLTPALELGPVDGGFFSLYHEAILGGLVSGQRYFVAVTCLDESGNLSVQDENVFTEAVATAAPHPAVGDVYRETITGFGSGNEDWRVTDPDAANPGAAVFLPNPVLTVEVPDLTGAVRAELVIDRWGGHPGTTGKKIRLNGGSWLHVVDPETIPDNQPECYVYQDQPRIALPLDQLTAGTVTLEGSADEQTCDDFDWGQWGWYAAVVRVYYDGSVSGPSGAVLSPAAGDTIVDLATVNLDVAPGVDKVHLLARYDGFDGEGDGVYDDWHGYYRRERGTDNVNFTGHLGTLDTAPWTLDWDATWVPDQAPGSVALQARLRGTDGVWSVVGVDSLSLRHAGAVVKAYPLTDVPRSFWVRAGQVKSAHFTIPAADSLAVASAARLEAATWNGRDGGIVRVNGSTAASGFGLSHFFSVDAFDLAPSVLDPGENTLEITSGTIHHGMEMLWPGPLVTVRYGDALPAAPLLAGDVTGDGRRDEHDARALLAHLVGAAPLAAARLAAADADGDGAITPADAVTMAGWDQPKAAAAGDLVIATDAAAPDVAVLRAGALAGRHLVGLTIVGPDVDRTAAIFGPGATAVVAAWHARGDTLQALMLAEFGDEDSIAHLAIDHPVQIRATLDGAPWTELHLGATDLPSRFALVGNAPNPFNPLTKVAFELPRAADVRVRVYDLAGRLVATLVDEPLPAGRHAVTWTGRDDAGRRVASGTFFARMEAAGRTWTHKMMLLK